MKKILFFLLLATAAAWAQETIKVISSLPLTGSARTQSQTMVNGFLMAFEEAGSRAGPFKIVYESLDDATAQAGAWDPGQEKKNASRAVADPDCMVYTGVYNSGAAKISIPILNQAEMCMLSSGSTYSGLTKAGFGEKGEPDIYYPGGFRNYCRVVPADDLQGKAAAWWAQKLGVESVYILDDKELYGKGIARVFDEECRKRGIQVLGHEGIDAKAPDYRAVMNKIKTFDPDLIYFGGITQNGAPKLVKDARDVGLTCRFMSPDGTKEEAFIQGAGPAAEGCLVTLGGVPVQELGPEAQDWYKRYKQRFNAEPEAYAIYSYEAGNVILKAIEKAGVKDRRKILDAIMGTKDYTGVLGTWSFDKNGDTTMSSMSGYEVKGGQFGFVEVLTPEVQLPPVAQTRKRQSGTSPLAALVETVLTGLANGSLIAVIALGYTLVYGIVELINFAHGDVFMMGSFAALTGVSLLGLTADKPAVVVAAGLLLVLALAMGFSGCINVLIDRLAYRRLRHAPRLVPLITAIGMSFILMNLGGYWKGWAPVYFPKVLPDVNLIPGISFKLTQLCVILITVPLLGGLYWFVYRTRLGKAMRATAQSPDAAQLMGIDVNRTIALAFLLGGALAGAAGLVFGLYNQEVRFDLGFRQGLNAFTAAVLGGIGNIQGAVLGGIVIGIVEALTAYYLSQALAPAMVFAVLIVIIMIRPSGLLGENVPEKV